MVQGRFLMGCGAGFSGDRIDAPVSVVDTIAASGLPGAIMFETLGERTLALGHLARRADPSKGYEPLLEALLAPILPTCVRSGIPIVGNFGAANPGAAAEAVAVLAKAAGLDAPRIAVVTGDDITATASLDAIDVWEGERGAVFDQSKLIAANVYLGARAIADAIMSGAQVVITGRVADPALALGPLMAHFGWQWDDWNMVAAGTLVGHLLECGAQVTGGYFADPGYKDVPAPENIGFPIAEVSADGSAIVTKAAGTGGIVDLRTVKEQLLYEVHDPAAYLTPDVTLDITGVIISMAGKNRVRVAGAKGRPPPPDLKATFCFEGDWFGEAEISYAGANCLARARLAAATIRKRISLRRLPVNTRFDMIGAASVLDSDAGQLQAEMNGPIQEVRFRLAASAMSKTAVECALQEVLALYCCGPAGGGGVRTKVSNRIKTVSGLVPRAGIEATSTFWSQQ